jgi:hypothetical protein
MAPLFFSSPSPTEIIYGLVVLLLPIVLIAVTILTELLKISGNSASTSASFCCDRVRDLRWQRRDLALPLLDSSHQRQEDDEAAKRASAIVWRREMTYDCGVALFTAGYIVGFYVLMFSAYVPAAADYYDDDKDITNAVGKPGWDPVLYALLQTAGLLSMALSHIDANLYLRRNRLRASLFATVATVTMLVSGALALHGLVETSRHPSRADKLPAPLSKIVMAILVAVPILPFLYLLLPCRFGRIMEMGSPHLPRFTELLHCTLVLFLASNCIGLICYAVALSTSNVTVHDGTNVISISGQSIALVTALVAAANFVGAAATVAAYRRRRQCGDSLTLALNYSILVFLLCYGAIDIFSRMLGAIILHIPASPVAYLFGTIHVVPAVYLLGARSSLYRWLGQQQLQEAKGLAALEAQEIGPEDGSLAQIETKVHVWDQGETFSVELRLDEMLNSYQSTKRGRAGGLSATEHGGYTLLHFACWNGYIDSVKKLLEYGVDVHKGTMVRRQPALTIAALRGHADCALLLIEAGADVHQKIDGQTALMAALAANQTSTLQVLLENGAGDRDPNEAGVPTNARPGTSRWMSMDAMDAAEMLGRKTALQIMRAHESKFSGNILPTRGGTCVASWPGIYAKLWDRLVADGKSAKLSAAVVFLPKFTPNFGRCGSDKCYCVEMYGEQKDWGCKWFQLWREHIQKAVSLGQRLQVYYYEGRVGAGKLQSSKTLSAWAACSDDAKERDRLVAMKQQFLRALPPKEKARLEEMSSEARDDSRGQAPGSARGDEAECLFIGSLADADRHFYQAHKGLGNSQKAEVAWLEEMGFEYEELDVRDFEGAPPERQEVVHAQSISSR